MSRAKGWVIGAVVVLGICGAVVAGRARTSGAVAAGRGAQTKMKHAKGATDASGVMYFSHEETAEGRKESLVLDDRVPETNYRVAVYHRDKGGEVEIHMKDTDVFYIVAGAATFVTGGTVTGSKEIEAGEFRGGTMQGGVERQLSTGDVIVIPANVAHWYKEVQQPITYFGVKVR